MGQVVCSVRHHVREQTTITYGQSHVSLAHIRPENDFHAPKPTVQNDGKAANYSEVCLYFYNNFPCCSANIFGIDVRLL